jgi:hypothetical protein
VYLELGELKIDLPPLIYTGRYVGYTIGEAL